jgi:hypothetical protein
MSASMLTDIGGAGASRGKVEDKAGHQSSCGPREDDLLGGVLPTAGVGKFKQIGGPS